MSGGLLYVPAVNKDSNKDILRYYPTGKLFKILTITNGSLMC